MRQLKTIHLEGMSCEHCENAVEKGLKTLKWVKKARASHEKGFVLLEYKHSYKENAVKEIIKDLGYIYNRSE